MLFSSQPFFVVLIGVSDILVMASTDLRHVAGSGFPWMELIVVYLPAAIHEELLFRGYPYQKVRSVNRSWKNVTRNGLMTTRNPQVELE